MEICPKCGVLLEVIECCGGCIYRCDVCGEYYFYGELIESQREFEEVKYGMLKSPSTPLE